MDGCEIEFTHIVLGDFRKNPAQSEIGRRCAGALVTVQRLKPGQRTFHKEARLHQDLFGLQYDWQEVVSDNAHIVKERKPTHKAIAGVPILVLDD